jgi:glycosyltransferase involved in cell wall biosynthesis
MSKIALSVITPVLNAAPFLEACASSVRSQHRDDVEHIIVDGGSTDGSLETARKLAGVDSRVRLIEGPDQGQSDAMNKGLRAARGSVVGFLNVDDSYEPGAINDGLKALGALGSPALVAGKCRVINAEGTTIAWNRPRELSLAALLTKHYPRPCNPSAYFYHRAVHDLVGYYDLDEHQAMDTDFLLRCAHDARVRMAYVSRHWGNFRLAEGCKTFFAFSTKSELAGERLIRSYREKASLGLRGKMFYFRMRRAGLRRLYNLIGLPPFDDHWDLKAAGVE